MKKRWFAAMLLVSAAGAGLYLSSRSEAGAKPIDASLRVDVKRSDLVIEVVDTGKIQPKEKIEIKSRVGGQVLEVLVEEGQKVKKGDLLLRLDPVDYQREVAKAEAALAQAQNALEFAQLSLERKQLARKGQGVAQIDVDLAKNEVKTRMISVKSARIELATAKDRLRYTRLNSPIDGTILEVGIKQGEVVTPGIQQTFEGRPLMLIGDLSTLIVETELNQIDIAKIALEQRVKLSFDALPGEAFEAKVTKIAPAAIKPKGKEIEVFPVEATLLLVATAIKPGMTADVRFQVERKPGVFTVPIEAVVKNEGKSYVTKIVVLEGKETTERAEVRLGSRNDRELEIQGGVAEGDKLLIDPASSKENEVEL